MNDPSTGAAPFLADLERRFAAARGRPDGMEVLSLADHMLQTAAAAVQAGAPHSLIAAALLHDVGHWLHGAPRAAGGAETDLRHEAVGERCLARYFGPEVTRPVALHVAAKRYLCAREPTYLARLTRASVHSLGLQGGPMSEAEALAFEADPAHRDAVALRRWDEYGKVPDLEVADFGHYRPLLEGLMADTGARGSP